MRYLSVALYHPNVLPGGAQYAAKDLFDAAVAEGVDAWLLAAINAHEFPSHVKTGAPITRLPETEREYLLLTTNFENFFHTSYDPRRIKAIREFLHEIKPDVVHIHHSLFVGLDFIDLVKRELPKARIIYTLHEYLPICHANGQLYRYKEKSICMSQSADQCVKCFPAIDEDMFILRKMSFMRSFANVDLFIAPSQYLADVFIKWGLPQHKVRVVLNGSTPLGEIVRPVKKDRNIFGFFGQYVDAKGIDVLLEAFASLSGTLTQPVEIHVYGGNKQYASEEYRGRIAELIERLPDSITYKEMGKYDRRSIGALMSGIDWLIVPSKWPETFGLVLSEAFECGTPAIVADTGGLSERITDGVNGFKFLAGNPSTLASVIMRCLEEDGLWERINQAIRAEPSVGQRWTEIRALFDQHEAA